MDNTLISQELEAPFPLLSFPPELLEYISVHLEDPDLINIRRVCRALNGHTVNIFGKRFFRHLAVFLHPTSLTTLLKICHHPAFAKYVHRVTVCGEQFKQHKDLQLSVEQSRMDRTILTEVFQVLKNLQTVAAFAVPQEDLSPNRAITCALKQLFGDDDIPFHSHTRGYDRVYELVMQTLEEANIHDKMDLLFDFWGTDTPAGMKKPFFDIASPAWNQHFANQVRAISLTDNANPDWIKRLLTSTPNVLELAFYGNGFSLDLPSPSVGLRNKAKLRHLDIYNVFFPHDDWVAFLRLHADTLETLYLKRVGFITGNWRESLEVIGTMPQIQDASFSSFISPSMIPSPMTPPTAAPAIAPVDIFEEFGVGVGVCDSAGLGDGD
ncbi:predicted protein [Pyrenophora tritici-repentis Pt-1C-BFP]|uniref:F-box domain-containing protein n=1 Tax=Pyrenophora tritici-repentis (strain Pt-1C-BFP) TaxID=426418 RepID=B2VUQ0_PYRTR|nr:uncharacterized protein PTRG_02154 [Pyrenophora tritici-repentis Pt-1C-BFP]EDU41592.1 predicted protein [Pyrenophora tritici-repentis Pt-1C-BFP]